MITTTIRFYEELNDFLPTSLAKTTLRKRLLLPTSVKDLIESYGIPHTEVDLILVNGEAVAFDYKIADRDHISVYPVFESFDISPIKHSQDKALRNPIFFTERYLWKLTRQLRLLGMSVFYDATLTNKQIIESVVANKWILLTRSVNQLKYASITRGYCIRSDQPFQQTLEVIKRFDLSRQLKPFTRCMLCNGNIISASKQEVEKRLESITLSYYHEFSKCADCGKAYWKGSHYSKLQKFVGLVKNSIECL
jgi:uncharacterized protein with PIN domain/sulfur carrier protein ThiS